jgi:hypothetical protein
MKRRWGMIFLLFLAAVAFVAFELHQQSMRAYARSNDAIDDIAYMELQTGNQKCHAFVASVQDHRLKLRKQLTDGTLKPSDIDGIYFEMLMASGEKLVALSPAEHKARMETLDKKLQVTP